MNTSHKLPGDPSGQPVIPGVRYRTEIRQRLVPHTIDGETRMVPEPYKVALPVPPCDWDRTVLRAVTGTATAVTVISVTWTTAGIGALLAPVAPRAIAYGAAGIFDLAWLACQAVEWLERYDPQRAQVARRAGWLALLIAVSAVLAHGLTSRDAAAGAIGGVVSVIAKGLWVIVLRHNAVPLGPRVGGWLLQRRQEVAAQRALALELRRLDAQEAYTTAAFGLSASAARLATAAAEVSSATAPEPQEGSAASPSGSSDHTASDMVRPLPFPHRPSIADTIRTCMSEGITSDLETVARVREVHGDRKNLVDTVTRTRRRLDRRLDS